MNRFSLLLPVDTQNDQVDASITARESVTSVPTVFYAHMAYVQPLEII